MSTDDRGAIPEPLPTPSPLPRSAKPAWWVWPLVFLALVPNDWLFHWLRPLGLEATAPSQHELSADAAELALLKVQAQFVIAASRVEADALPPLREGLLRSASSDRALAALALLESFLDPASPSADAMLQHWSDSVPDQFAELVRRAVNEGLDEEDRDQLRLHLGWFSKLARAPQLASPPQEETLVARAVMIVTVMGVAFCGVLVGLLVGAFLLLQHLRQLHAGLARNAFVPSDWHRGTLMECFALYLGFFALTSLLGDAGMLPSALVGNLLPVLLPLLWPWVRGLRWREFRHLLGLHRGRGIVREIAAGISGYLVVLAVASIGIALTLGLTYLAGVITGPDEVAAEAAAGAGEVESLGRSVRSVPAAPETHPIIGWIYEGGFWARLVSLALAAGFAPLFEELFFRGALWRYLRSRHRFLGSALFSSLIFAALHPQGALAIPALASLGIGFALLREWRDSLIASMTAHSLHNGCLVLLWFL